MNVDADISNKVASNSGVFDSSRGRKGRGGAAVFIEDTNTVSFPPLQSNTKSLKTDNMSVGEFSTASISPYPKFERLRASAREDRVMWFLKRQQELKRAEELRLRRADASQQITMEDYYATQFRPSLPTSSNTTTINNNNNNNNTKTGVIPEAVPQLRARDVLLKDIEESFIACYFRMYPEALQRRKEMEEAEAQRRRSTLAAQQIAALAGGAATRSRSLTPTRNQSKSKSKKKARKERDPPPPEGAPAVNLRTLQAALVEAADARGFLTCETLISTLSVAPFEVRDAEAVESFFFSIRAAASARDGADSEAERRLDGSCSTTTSFAKGGRGGSQRLSNVQQASSPLLNTGARRTRHNSIASFSNIYKRQGLTPRTSKGVAAFFITPNTAGGGGGGSNNGGGGQNMMGEGNFAAPTVRVRDVLAAIDAVMNGKELSLAVRAICFGVLESDGFIHTSTLRTLRTTRRASCEGKDAVITPSIIKALGDAMSVMLKEEEEEYIRSQAKGKRRAKGSKASGMALLPHQKSVIPLHMMRRSHMNKVEFNRFFEEMPFFAAAFIHVWLPAFFASSWPPVKKPVNDNVTDDNANEDENNNLDFDNNNNNDDDKTSEFERLQRDILDWEKVVVGPLAGILNSAMQRRNAARRIVNERLENMKASSAGLSVTTLVT